MMEMSSSFFLKRRNTSVSKLLQSLHHGVCPKTWGVGQAIDVREDQVRRCRPATRGACDTIVRRSEVQRKGSLVRGLLALKKAVAARTRNSTCSLVRLGVGHSRSRRRSGSQCPSATTLHLALSGPSPFALSRNESSCASSARAWPESKDCTGLLLDGSPLHPRSASL